MASETERKFLVKDSGYKDLETASICIRQGYLQRDPERTVRVRTKGDKGFLTVKGKTTGCTRLEFEYEIPYQDALQMLQLCQGVIINKIRHIVPYGGYTWEIDEFLDNLAPLIVAEIELPAEDAQFELPPFVGEEVTSNPKYYNSNLK